MLGRLMLPLAEEVNVVAFKFPINFNLCNSFVNLPNFTTKKYQKAAFTSTQYCIYLSTCYPGLPNLLNACVCETYWCKLTKYSGDLKSQNLNCGNNWVVNFYLFVIQKAPCSDAGYHGTGHLISAPVFKWWSEYQTTMVLAILILNHSRIELILMI